MNSPPGTDQPLTDFQLEQSIDMPLAIDGIVFDFTAAPEPHLFTSYRGGVVLQVDGATWSATTTTTQWTKRPAMNLLASVNQLEGLFRLSVGDQAQSV